MGIAEVVWPLVGVVVGSGMTSGFEMWRRSQDKDDLNRGLLAEAALAVQDRSTEMMHRSDLFTIALKDSPGMQDVMEGERFDAFNQAAGRYMGAIARARIVAAPYPALRASLIAAQDSTSEVLIAARTAASAIGTPDHLSQLHAYSAALEACSTLQNEFTRAAVRHFEDEAKVQPG